MKSFIKRLHISERGFTLIELLVVIAILGVLAAVAIPNVGRFIGQGKAEAASTELHNVQTAVMAAMADSTTGNVSAGNPVGGTTINFGDADGAPGGGKTPDLEVDPGPPQVTVGEFIVGGVEKVTGSYAIDVEGTVTQIWYPN